MEIHELIEGKMKDLAYKRSIGQDDQLKSLPKAKSPHDTKIKNLALKSGKSESFVNRVWDNNKKLYAPNWAMVMLKTKEELGIQ